MGVPYKVSIHRICVNYLILNMLLGTGYNISIYWGWLSVSSDSAFRVDIYCYYGIY
jgi:hypothetical protein